MNEKGRHALLDLSGTFLWVFGLLMIFGSGLFVGYTYAYNDLPFELDTYRVIVTDTPWDDLDPSLKKNEPARATMTYTVFYYLTPVLILIGTGISQIGGRLWRKHRTRW